MTSSITARIGTRYDDLIDYFRRYPFGSIPQDMTVLSLLPPIDRVLILERIFSRGYGDLIAMTDKLSMAYIKSGYEEIPFEFLKACRDCGLLHENAYRFFVAKLRGLNVHGTSDDYSDTAKKLPRYVYVGEELGDILMRLCSDYGGKEIFAGVSALNMKDQVDHCKFVDERRGFIRLIAKRKCRVDAIGVWEACASGDIDTFKDMIPLGVDVNCRLNCDGDTPLTKSIMSGHTEFAVWLIDNGANPSLSLHNGRTPLITASGRGDARVVTRLIRSGVSLDAQMRNGCTALMYAITKSHIDIANLLVAAGASKNIRDNDGWSVFDYATNYGVDVSKL